MDDIDADESEPRWIGMGADGSTAATTAVEAVAEGGGPLQSVDEARRRSDARWSEAGSAGAGIHCE